MKPSDDGSAQLWLTVTSGLAIMHVLGKAEELATALGGQFMNEVPDFQTLQKQYGKFLSLMHRTLVPLAHAPLYYLPDDALESVLKHLGPADIEAICCVTKEQLETYTDFIWGWKIKQEPDIRYS